MGFTQILSPADHLLFLFFLCIYLCAYSLFTLSLGFNHFLQSLSLFSPLSQLAFLPLSSFYYLTSSSLFYLSPFCAMVLIYRFGLCSSILYLVSIQSFSPSLSLNLSLRPILCPWLSLILPNSGLFPFILYHPHPFLSAAIGQRPRNYLSCSSCSCSPFGSFTH